MPLLTFTAPVLPGHGHGDELGAPTANFDLSHARDIERGLYACHARLEDKAVSGLLYYGYNSLTHQDCLEVHFLDFSGDLYSQKITITVDRYIRAEKKFATPEALSAQIKQDLAEAKIV